MDVYLCNQLDPRLDPSFTPYSPFLPRGSKAMYWKTTCALATGLAALSSALPAVVDKDVRDEFVGQGQIHVLNSSSLSTAAPTDRMGCLNEHGMLTMSDSECAVFTRLDGGFGTSVKLSTSSGNCTFLNPSMPTNKDSYYGSDSHAWSCWDVPSPEYDSVWEHYYTIVST
jgi:hypothetical protein